MARKMALLPSELLDSYNFQYKPEIKLEETITDLLEQEKLPDDVKVKLLSNLLMRFQRQIRQPKEPVRVTIAENENKEILTQRNDETKFNDNKIKEIILSTPKNYKKFIPLILQKLERINVSFNENGELIVNQNIIKNSNIIDLFSFIMRNRKHDSPPVGFMSFWKIINDVNTPQRWIGNESLHSSMTKTIIQDKELSFSESPEAITSFKRVQYLKKSPSFRKSVKISRWKPY